MIGLGTVSNNLSEEGAPQPSSIISCNCQNRSGILFYKSNIIRIENLTIEDCGAKFTFHRPDNFTVVSALTFRESHNIKLTRLQMNRNIGFGLLADRIFCNLTVSNSAFLWYKPYKLNKQHTIGGNARFWYSVYHVSGKETEKQTQLNTIHTQNRTLLVLTCFGHTRQVWNGSWWRRFVHSHLPSQNYGCYW